MSHLTSTLDRLFNESTVKNIMIRVGNKNGIVIDVARTAENRRLTSDTLFDIASVTKIVATTSLTLIAMDKGLLSPQDKVSKYFPVSSDKEELTVFNLLTHTFGIGHKSMLPAPQIYGDIQNYILNIPSDIPIGSDVKYSCPAYILLGRILEEIYGERLDTAFYKNVAEPLGLCNTRFLPDTRLDIVNSNLTDEEKGLVNDYNARYLGGVCGNAGLFSSLADMTAFAEMLLANGKPLFSERTFLQATKNHTSSMAESRGLGFLVVDERYAQTGGLFPTGSFGHCGHTGQSLFIDPQSGLYAIVLSDATNTVKKKYGHSYYEEVMQMRHDIHAAIKLDIQKGTALI